MKRYKKRNKIFVVLLILLGITIGFAAISTTLKLNGSVNVSKHTWKVYWRNPVVTTGSKVMTAPVISDDDEQDDTKATWSVSFDLPGEFYEFTIEAVNEGDIDVMVTDIIDTVTPALPNYVSYTFTYADGQQIEEKHKLAKATGGTPTVETYKVRVEYLMDQADASTVNQMSADTTYTYTFGVVYATADDTAIDRN